MWVTMGHIYEYVKVWCLSLHLNVVYLAVDVLGTVCIYLANLLDDRSEKYRA